MTTEELIQDAESATIARIKAQAEFRAADHARNADFRQVARSQQLAHAAMAAEREAWDRVPSEFRPAFFT